MLSHELPTKIAFAFIWFSKAHLILAYLETQKHRSVNRSHTCILAENKIESTFMDHGDSSEKRKNEAGHQDWRIKKWHIALIQLQRNPSALRVLREKGWNTESYWQSHITAASDIIQLTGTWIKLLLCWAFLQLCTHRALTSTQYTLYAIQAEFLIKIG